MRKVIFFYSVLFVSALFSQTDYSKDWQDFFSYNDVKDVIIDEDLLIALTENAFFTYDLNTKEINKFSSIQGLSGEETSSIFYSKAFNRIVIGYKSGLLEIIDDDGSITVAADIKNFNQSGGKAINNMAIFNNSLYLATPFALVVYNIEKLEFGDTYFIGANSSEENINAVEVLNNTIYCATNNGIFSADATNTSLVDFNNWNQQNAGVSYKTLTTFNNKVFTSLGASVYEVDNQVIPVLNISAGVTSLKADEANLFVTTPLEAFIFNKNLQQQTSIKNNTSFPFSLQNFTKNNANFYLATKEFGVLEKVNNANNFISILPDGPLFNDIFSIDVFNQNIWVVYGGYDNTYTPLALRRGFSNYIDNTWTNFRYDPQNPLPDLVNVTINKNEENSAFISAMGDTGSITKNLTGGLLEVRNNQIAAFYNQLNSPLEDIEANNPNRVTIRITGAAFDRTGNLWLANLGVNNRLKKLNSDGSWDVFNINSRIFNSTRFGFSDLVIDNVNTIWVGSRSNGLLAFNEDGNRLTSLTTSNADGNLPNQNIRSLAIDSSNRVWIGTITGLVVYNNSTGVFNDNFKQTNPIIFEEDGIAKRLLGEQAVNTIAVDGAQNKWFGTDAGLIQTNASGLETLATFTTENSPLPSNKIVDIKVDDSTGKVYVATDRGMVSYDSKVAPFGEELTEVYAYPNPVLKRHSAVTINGRNGKNLPRGTNVKILDVSGKLVFESNVIEGQEVQGGKVVWNKKNLAGKKVASGVYVVLLSNEDNTQSSTTKIAIVN